MRPTLLSVLVPAVLATPAAVLAQTPDTSPIATLALSRAMFDAAVAEADPAAMVAAASLRRSVFLDADPVAASSGLHDAQIIGWEQMLDAAAAVAPNDAALMGQIADARAFSVRGVSTGALFRNATLAPGSATEFEALSFDGATAAEVYVEGIEASDLNLFVYDESKQLVCADEDASYIAHCYWEPEAPGSYVIKVVNGGAITSSYALITN